jgi:hypothetical protein
MFTRVWQRQADGSSHPLKFDANARYERLSHIKGQASKTKDELGNTTTLAKMKKQLEVETPGCLE